jgi:signal transduction histidine kinase
MLVAPRFANSGVRLATRDLAPRLPVLVTGYPNEFKQSLLNLVSNALDAVLATQAPPGANGCVVISLSAPAGQVVIEVQDDGCGIAPEHASRVFDPYFTTKSGDQGTGIGLYMTRLIIEESMAGQLNFTSDGQGTCFRITLAREPACHEVPHD